MTTSTKTLSIVVVLVVAALVVFAVVRWYTPASSVPPTQTTSTSSSTSTSSPTSPPADITDLPQTYTSPAYGFTIRYPDGFSVESGYAYQELGPGKDIPGIKFTIPPSMTTGTNLASDTGITVEALSTTSTCSPTLFLPDTVSAVTMTDASGTYSVASSTGAGAGNRYEETVYAFPQTHPCIAVRYFVHYGVIENYPAGMVHEFDAQSLLAQFDKIRRSIVITSTSTAVSDMIHVATPLPNAVVTSTFAVSGEARGNWFFEASFPVKLFDANGVQLAATTARALSDWMTTSFVPFSTKVTFSPPTTTTGTLVLQKDNPSGLPQNDAEIRIPVKF